MIRLEIRTLQALDIPVRDSNHNGRFDAGDYLKDLRVESEQIATLERTEFLLEEYCNRDLEILAPSKGGGGVFLAYSSTQDRDQMEGLFKIGQRLPSKSHGSYQVRTPRKDVDVSDEKISLPLASDVDDGAQAEALHDLQDLWGVAALSTKSIERYLRLTKK